MAKIPYKTLTLFQITNKAKKLEKSLRKMYNELDNLMDEADISALECEGYEKKQGSKEMFDRFSNIIGVSRGHCELAYDELQLVVLFPVKRKRSR